ncbi:MAG: PIN domain-containing protein [Kofleriaceae bacterium]|nr:PIN domain-containing protein [Kofleriaceae bacterium]
MQTAIADTGFWLALLSANDRHHALARSLHQSKTWTYVTTWPVLTEACHLLTARVHAEAAIGLLEAGKAGAYRIADTPSDALQRAAVLMRRYVKLPMDLADASLVILAEDLGHGRILSTDRRDFHSYRWKNRKPFSNLMFPAD